MNTERRGRHLAWASALVVALMLAGCTPGAAGGTVPPAPTSTAGTGASATSSPTGTATTNIPSGNTSQTVEPRTQTTAKPVDLDQPQRDGDVVVSLTSIKAQKVKAVGPGEIGGASLVVTVRIRNGTADDLDVDSTYVTLIDSKGKVAVGLTNNPSQPFSGSITPGKSATGVYVFRVPTNTRSKVRVSVTYSMQHPTAVFVGSAR